MTCSSCRCRDEVVGALYPEQRSPLQEHVAKKLMEELTANYGRITPDGLVSWLTGARDSGDIVIEEAGPCMKSVRLAGDGGKHLVSIGLSYGELQAYDTDGRAITNESAFSDVYTAVESMRYARWREEKMARNKEMFDSL